MDGFDFVGSLVEAPPNDVGLPIISSSDDFDSILADMAHPLDDLSQAELFRLHEECRLKKESLNPNSRKIVIDLEAVRPGMGSATISVSDFYDRCMPLIEETIHATDDLIGRDADLECLYVTGGGAELPIVSRILKERYGRKVRRSAYTRSATAIGLAIQADTQAGYVLREKFTRFFGVWRESDSGRAVAFDPLFAKGLELPSAGDPPLTQEREYTPVHNIGHFRYLECSHVDHWNQPAGDIAVWDEIQFPFDPASRDKDLAGVPVRHIEPGMHVREIYTCDSAGTVQVKIENLSAGYERTYKLGRWAAKANTVVPGKAKRGTKKKAASAA